MWSCTDNKTKFLTKSNKTKFLTNYKKTNVRFLHIFNNKILHSIPDLAGPDLAGPV